MKQFLTFLFAIFFFSLLVYSQHTDKPGKPVLTEKQKILLDQYSNEPDNIPVNTPMGIIQWSEGFEGTTFPPAGWAVHQLDGGTNTWLRYTSTPIYGTASATVRWESSTLMNDDWLVTPQFLVHSGDMFRFYAKGSTSFYDSVQIYYSTAGGVPPTGYNYITTFRPTTAALFEVPLTAYTGQNIYMAFRYYAIDELRLYIDSVYVETPVDLDAGMVSIGLPAEAGPGVKTPTAVVKNFGALTQSFNVTLQISGGYTSTQSVSSLAPGASQEVTFANWTATLGAYTAKAFTQLTGDMNPANDTMYKSVAIVNLLYDNGPLVTHPGGGPGGSDVSALVTPLNVYGWNINNTLNYRMADDFIVPPDTIWTINSIELFGYQTGSTTTSTFNFASFRIWNGEPAQPGSNVVFGDITTNYMTSTSWTNIYRSTLPTIGTTRPIMSIVCNISLELNPGTYWIDFGLGGTGSSGPWGPPVTILGQLVTGNALQYAATYWTPLVDSVTTPYPQGVPFKLKGDAAVIPVELASFKADVSENSVTLSWATATETNNSGFDIERSIKGNEFVKIGHVNGHGTTTEVQSYSFTDSKLSNGTYSYRLKQIDLDGTFNYSSVVNADVDIPMVYSLDQNYPNPFNPSTKINFSLAADSKVSLKVYNILGQETAVIVDAAMTAGSYTYSFDASKLNSSVYFYQLEANGNDGSSFKSVKKMILTK